MPIRSTDEECWCCRLIGAQLDDEVPAPPLACVWACRPGDEAHHVLRLYKDGPVAEQRRRFASVLQSELQQFLLRHQQCVTRAFGPVDAVAVVPSSRRPARGPVRHPLESLFPRCGPFDGLPRIPLRPGPEPPGHLRAFRRGAVIDEPVVGKRVLLFEDTWVTGARARSAAAALGDAGAGVAGVVVLARAVDPSASPTSARWWAAARRGGTSLLSSCGLGECRHAASAERIAV